MGRARDRQRPGVAGISGTGATGYAGYFDGKVHVNGTLSKGGGSFKIDHPLDPENKYLYHSFVESPDMKNIYNGNVDDRRGRASRPCSCRSGSRRSTATSATSSR